eukprot:2660208-Pyramimonas_sp.AAC.1
MSKSSGDRITVAGRDDLLAHHYTFRRGGARAASLPGGAGWCSDTKLVAVVAQPILGRFTGFAAPVASANGWWLRDGQKRRACVGCAGLGP